MSKIFDALRKADVGMTEPVLTSLIGTPLDSVQEKTGVGGEMPSAAATPPAGSEEIGMAAEDRALPPPPTRICPIRLHGSAPLLPFDDLDWSAGEQYRIVRTKIIQHPKQPRLLVISSPGSADGKSITAINLAGALSLKSGGRVLLVDGDLRRASIHALLGLPEGPGLGEVLRGICRPEAALVQTEQFPNLSVLTAGEVGSNPAELFDSSRWSALCQNLRNSFKYVVVDSPPIAAVADYDLIQAPCDGIVLVLRPDHTPRKLAMKAVEAIPKERLIGVVLNHVDDWFLNRNNLQVYRYSQAYKLGREAAGNKQSNRSSGIC